MEEFDDLDEEASDAALDYVAKLFKIPPPLATLTPSKMRAWWQVFLGEEVLLGTSKTYLNALLGKLIEHARDDAERERLKSEHTLLVAKLKDT